MTGIDAIKAAVEDWWIPDYPPPEYINKLCSIVYKLKKEVFNLDKGTWEYEGFRKEIYE